MIVIFKVFFYLQSAVLHVVSWFVISIWINDGPQRFLPLQDKNKANIVVMESSQQGSERKKTLLWPDRANRHWTFVLLFKLSDVHHLDFFYWFVM